MPTTENQECTNYRHTLGFQMHWLTVMVFWFARLHMLVTRCSTRAILKVLSKQNLLKLYLSICLVDGLDYDMPSSMYDSISTIKMYFSGILLGESINTLSGSCTKQLVCLHFYLQTMHIKQLFVHMSGNKQSIYRNGLAIFSTLVMIVLFTLINSPLVKINGA